MIEYNNKHQKDIGTTEDSSKHKKKSNKKGLSRSKHKHENIYVKLIGFDKFNPERIVIASVCKICGRIAESWYVRIEDDRIVSDSFFNICPIENTKDLPLYKADKPFGKFATLCDSCEI